ncbi:glycosyltransferase family 2 protein [Alteromonas sp. BMJM2]|uniref:glycosyltransferase family 2 protein n=1 Tax=Alteromonas sp. BMJM2 TaxID=2954241 RepID=UPI0022B54A39|nr:glycosyltransferase [Alteromonas sp. BMJM2]
MERLSAQIGAVVIGRNEGERLRACLQSLKDKLNVVYYVDSGSTDQSVDMAKALGVEVIELDMSVPFTAARARNIGANAIVDAYPNLAYVQFVDGDCEVASNWLESAFGFMETNTATAACCGRRRERYPENSFYNWLCDVEWNTPVGKAKACGGDALIRLSAFNEVGGYRNDLIAGEEPEMCVRLRNAGYKIYRIDSEMTLHDANIMHFSQWWKRAVRGGFAFAQGASIHGKAPEKHKVKERNRVMFWAGLLPTLILLSSILFHPIFAVLTLLYPLSITKVYLNKKGKLEKAFRYSLFMMIGKFAEFKGALKFYFEYFAGKQSKLIEYK